MLCVSLVVYPKQPPGAVFIYHGGGHGHSEALLERSPRCLKTSKVVISFEASDEMHLIGIGGLLAGQQ